MRDYINRMNLRNRGKYWRFNQKLLKGSITITPSELPGVTMVISANKVSVTDQNGTEDIPDKFSYKLAKVTRDEIESQIKTKTWKERLGL